MRSSSARLPSTSRRGLRRSASRARRSSPTAAAHRRPAIPSRPGETKASHARRRRRARRHVRTPRSCHAEASAPVFRSATSRRGRRGGGPGRRRAAPRARPPVRCRARTRVESIARNRDLSLALRCRGGDSVARPAVISHSYSSLALVAGNAVRERRPRAGGRGRLGRDRGRVERFVTCLARQTAVAAYGARVSVLRFTDDSRRRRRA